MADPLTAVGAVASSIAIADAALSLSRRVYKFLDEVHSAKAATQRLRHELHQAENCMRNVRAFLQHRDTTRYIDHEHLNLSAGLLPVIEAYSQDVKLLAECLPKDLSPEFAQRVKFVFQKSKIDEATSRLRELQAVAARALAYVGSQASVQGFQGVVELQSHSRALGAQSDTIIQQLATVATTQDLATFESRIISALAEVQRPLLPISDQASPFPLATPPNVVSSLSNEIPNDIPLLVNLIQAEVKELLQPFSRIQGQLDDALPVIIQALAEKTQLISHNSETTIPMRQRSPARERGGGPETQTSLRPCAEVAAPQVELARIDRSRRRGGAVALFTTWHEHSSSLGRLQIRVSKFNPKHPRRPDSSIIFPHTVWTELDNILAQDDLPRFQQLLQDGDLSWRDVDEDGWSVVDTIFKYRSLNIFRYLCLDSSLKAVYMLESVWHDTYTYVALWSVSSQANHFNTFEKMQQFLRTLRDLNLDLLPAQNSSCAILLQIIVSEMVLHKPPTVTLTRITELFMDAGFSFQVFPVLRTYDCVEPNTLQPSMSRMAIVGLMLNLYLERGCDPNAIQALEWPLLVEAIFTMVKSRQDLQELQHFDEDQAADWRDTCKRILCDIIYAGADVSFIIQVESVGAFSMSQFAVKCGTYDILCDALEECGYDLDLFKDEQERQEASLRGSQFDRNATSIDTQVLAPPDASGLRRRRVAS